ncbi:MAG TPA: LptE family protein [Phycisphaerae bacterium]|nr:LptE family protein [Phycisphaerae bacterium]
MTTRFTTRHFSFVICHLSCAAFALLLPSCGYSPTPLYNRSVHTIAVPIFANKTFRREWEFKLTEAIDKNIEYRTPYKIVPQNRADTILSGEIVNIQESVLTRRFGTILPRESQITVVVNFTWRDARSGRVLLERRSFNRSATEIPQLDERVEDAEQLAIERLAQGIVDQLQRDWNTPATAATQPASEPAPPPPPQPATTSSGIPAPIIPPEASPATFPSTAPTTAP